VKVKKDIWKWGCRYQ